MPSPSRADLEAWRNLYLNRSVSPSSRRIYESALRDFVHAQNGSTIWERGSVARYVRMLVDRGISASTLRQRISCLRGFFAFLRELGVSEDLLSEGREIPLPPTPASAPSGVPFLERLFEACDDGTAAGLRDALVISLAYWEGLPPRRIARLKRTDLERLPLSLPTKIRLEAFRRYRNGSAGEMLVVSVSNRSRGRDLGPSAVNRILRKRALLAGLQDPPTARALSIIGRTRRWEEYRRSRSGGRKPA